VERSWVAVLAIQRPRCEGRRGLRVLGCMAALLAALVCASVLVATARAEDLPPPASDGAALSSDSIATDGASASSPDISATATDAADTAGTTTDATDATTDATDISATAAGATGTSGTAPDATDTSASATGATDTSATATGATDTSGTTTPATDPTTDATDTSGTTTPATDPTTDATGTSGATTPATNPARDATDTTGETSGAAPLDPSGGSDAQTSDSHSRRGERGRSDAANGSTDSVPPPSAPPLADGGSQLPSDSASSSGEAGGPSSDSSTSGSATPEARSDPTTSDSSFGATAFGDDPATALGLGDLSGSGAPAAGDEATVVPVVLAVGVISWGVNHRFIVACRSAILARAYSDSELVLLGQMPAHLQAAQVGQPGARTGGESGRPDGSQRPTSPRLPAPDDEPPVPTAPGSLLGSGSSGGFQSGTDLGVITALFSLIPPRDDRPVTFVEQRRRPLHLFFFLERPG
jgi:mucin-6/19